MLSWYYSEPASSRWSSAIIKLVPQAFRMCQRSSDASLIVKPHMLVSIDPFVDAVADEASGCACSSSNIAHMLSICTNKCSRDTGGKLPETFWSTFGNGASAPKVPMAPKHVSEKNMTCRWSPTLNDASCHFLLAWPILFVCNTTIVLWAIIWVCLISWAASCTPRRSVWVLTNIGHGNQL
jgi:hypothetical protein